MLLFSPCTSSTTQSLAPWMTSTPLPRCVPIKTSPPNAGAWSRVGRAREIHLHGTCNQKNRALYHTYKYARKRIDTICRGEVGASGLQQHQKGRTTTTAGKVMTMEPVGKQALGKGNRTGAITSATAHRGSA